jgi:hypothetical protein
MTPGIDVRQGVLVPVTVFPLFRQVHLKDYQLNFSLVLFHRLWTSPGEPIKTSPGLETRSMFPSISPAIHTA